MKNQKNNLWTNFSESKESSALNPITLTELFQNVYEGKQPIIKQLLYPGVYIFAGSPKVGKSFFVAQIGYKVSKGEPLWTGFDVRAGAVIYFSLEDTKARIQKRMADMFGVEGSDDFYIITADDIEDIGNLEASLEWQLELLFKKIKNLRLVIIDTLQKIRGKRGSSYNNDYDTIGRLKKIADKYSICILIVHHTTKKKTMDSFESISGSNGLLGCADGAFVMEKESRRSLRAFIEVVGRDISDQRLFLIKDEKSLIWNLENRFTDEVEESPNPILEKVAGLVNSEHPKWEGTATQLCKEIQTDMAPNKLTRKLNVGIGRLNREFGVQYSNEPKHEGRIITLTYSPQPDRQQNSSLCDNQKAAPHTDMTTESGSDTTCEITRDDCNDCNDSKIFQPTAVIVDSVKVVDAKVVVCEDYCDDCYGKNATSITVAADDSSVDTVYKAVCEEKRNACDDKNVVPITVAVDCSGANTADETVYVDERDGCDGRDDTNAIPSTVAVDGSDVSTVAEAVCLDGRNGCDGCNDQDASSIVIMEDGSTVNMADVVRVDERDDCNACDD